LEDHNVKSPIQVHADSSNFAAGVGKKEAYEQVIEQAAALFDGQRNWVRRFNNLWLYFDLS
jgi:putative methionine-R-sulfoxide reductase with GAF domain